jgi:hypothetical protein
MRFFFFLIFLPFVLTALASATNVTITTTTLPDGTVQVSYSRTVPFRSLVCCQIPLCPSDEIHPALAHRVTDIVTARSVENVIGVPAGWIVAMVTRLILPESAR